MKNENLIDVVIKSLKLSQVVFITDKNDNWIIAKFKDYRIKNELYIILTDVYFNNIHLSHDLYICYTDIKKIRFSFD